MWEATACTPGLFETHVKLHPASSFVIFHTAGKSRGCLIRTRLPMASGPSSIFFTRETDLVHCGQPSTSITAVHTRSTGAAI
jgi:hypothetical protein